MARKDAERVMIQYIDKLMPGGENKKLYEDLFKSMTNAEFDAFMKELEEGTQVLSIVAPNDGKHEIEISRAIDICEKLGKSVFTRLTITDEDGIKTETDIEYMVVPLPFRRTAQMIVKKISVPEDSKSVSLLTGQPTGKSQGAKMTYPEIQVLASMGLEKTLLEALKIRGGDSGSFAAMNASITHYGKVSQEQIAPYSTEVESSKTLKAYLTAMHLRANV